MMISPESYINEIKNYSLKELYEEKERLEEYIKKYENNELPSEDYTRCPLPDVICSMNLQYLSELEILIEKRKTTPNISEEQYYVLGVEYEDVSYSKIYNYLCDDTTITIGDKVLVDRSEYEAIAIVKEATYYTEENAPFPINKMKKIIKKVDNDYNIDYEDEDIENNEEEYILKSELDEQIKVSNTLRKMFINAFNGKISIKELMGYIKIKEFGEVYVLVFYNKKMNLFTARVGDDFFYLPSYGNLYISKKDIRKIIKDSISIPRKIYSNNNEEEVYNDALKFCEENQISYIDDYKNN